LDIPVFRYRRKNDESYLPHWMRLSREGAQTDVALLSILLFEEKVDDEKFHTDALFIMDHSFCDGLSILNLSKELFQLMSDSADFDPSKSLKIALPMDVLCRNSIGQGFFASFLRILKTAGIIIKLLRSPNPAYYPEGEYVKPADMALKCTCRPHTIEIDDVKPLLKKCKENKVTLGNLVTASLVFEIGSVLKSIGKDKRKIGIGIACDTRRLYSDVLEGIHLGFHVSSRADYTLALEHIPDKPLLSKEELWKRARDVKTFFEEWEDNYPLYIAQMLAPYFTYTAGTTHNQFDTIAVTNWGRLNMPTDFNGQWKVTNVFGMTNNLHMLMPTMIMSSFNGKLRLSMFVSEPAASPTLSAHIMKGLKERLESAV